MAATAAATGLLPTLFVVEAGFTKTYQLDQKPCSIGRSDENSVFLKNAEVSRRHAEVRKTEDGYSIVDVGSRNGFLVNGVPSKEHLLRHGDVVKVGLARLFFRQLGRAEAPPPPQAPSVDLNEELLDPAAIRLFTRANALSWYAIPLQYHREARRLVVAMVDPSNLGAIQEMELLTYCNVDVTEAGRKEVLSAIERWYPAMEDAVEEARRNAPSPADEPTRVGMPAVTEVDAERELGVSRLVTLIIEDAVRCEASDIHVEPRPDRVSIRYRIDGVMTERRSLPHDLQNLVVNRLKILANLDISERRFPQDGRCTVTVHMREVDLRVSTFPSIRGEKVVLRLLDRSVARVDIEALGMEDATRTQLLDLMSRSEGIILVTGPTGSGKTSTLYAAMNAVRNGELNMVTLEDPVEYEFPEITQGQVFDNPRFTFSSGLRSILRQDPDVILVGEMRDRETVQVAIQAALTGHLVLTTLHTNSAAAAIPRLVDMGTEPYLLSAGILGVVSQRLVRRICPHCKTVDHPSPELLNAAFPGHDMSGAAFYRGTGCDDCLNGYKGRIGTFELLPISESVRAMIIGQANASAIKLRAVQEGMVTLRDDALGKALRGVTTLEEVMRVTYSEF